MEKFGIKKEVLMNGEEFEDWKTSFNILVSSSIEEVESTLIRTFSFSLLLLFYFSLCSFSSISFLIFFSWYLLCSSSFSLCSSFLLLFFGFLFLNFCCILSSFCFKILSSFFRMTSFASLLIFSFSFCMASYFLQIW